MEEQANVLGTPSTQSRNEPLYRTQLMLDSRLAGISDTATYLVEKGAQDCTYYSELANSYSPSGISFNVVVPGLNVAVSKLVFLRATVQLAISGAPAVGSRLVDVAKLALAPFPLQSMFETMQATINTTSFNIEMKNNISKLLRNMDKDVLDHYACMTPTALDNYYNYSDAYNAVNNPLGSWYNGSNGFQPRGSFPFTISGDNSIQTVANTVKTVNVTFTVSEPLLISPFVVSPRGANMGGLTGINAMKFVFNISNAPSRAIRYAGALPAGTTVSIAANGISNPNLDFCFLSPFPSLRLPSRSVSPYLQVEKQETNIGSESPHSADPNKPAVCTASSNTIQLQGIPDKLILTIGKREADKACTDSDSFFPIKAVRVNFNNKTSILGTANQYNLWLISRKNGLQDDFNTFRGFSQVPNAGIDANGVSNILTSGSVVILNFAEDLSLSQDWETCGSLGVYSLNVQVDYYNLTGADIPINQLWLQMTMVNSGLFVSQLGSSSTYINMLTADEVLKASQQEPVNKNDYQRRLGGSFWSNMKSFAKKVKPVASAARAVLGNVNDPRAKAAASALGAVGAGRSAGGMSAGSRLTGRTY